MSISGTLLEPPTYACKTSDNIQKYIRTVLANYHIHISIYQMNLRNICIYVCIYISLSMVVLNSRDWYEIIWLPEISRFKINLAIGFIRKNQLECIDKAVMMLYLG